jgi:hypothetical protein
MNSKFSVSYDRETLDVAASRLFLNRWSPLFPYGALLVLGLGLGLTGYLISLQGFSFVTKLILFLTVGAAATWGLLLLRERTRLRAQAGSEVEFTLTEDSVTAKAGCELLTRSWNELHLVELTPECTLIYLMRGVALVIPNKDLPPDGKKLILERAKRLLSKRL